MSLPLKKPLTTFVSAPGPVKSGQDPAADSGLNPGQNFPAQFAHYRTHQQVAFKIYLQGCSEEN